ncbi:HD domain-containing protein [Xenorhabdus nematophila]|uniref:metal-dependent phosphohydrolase n=1 Tax=Xenorhabdus nematophila TaxID=628 RepID=UPI001F25B20E|nr:metal-dependent phosphohydrolase [Xenorhabdus nematophila]
MTSYLYLKNSPERHKSSEFAAKKTISIVKDYFKEVPVSKYGIIEEAIVSHSYSANIKPVSIEAKILQDSDRIDALGAVGLARVFYIAGKLNQKLFDLDDPFATHRELDDKVYALDHFYTKLLKLPITMNTKKGKEIAEVQSDFLLAYIEKLKKEIEIT